MKIAGICVYKCILRLCAPNTKKGTIKFGSIKPITSWDSVAPESVVNVIFTSVMNITSNVKLIIYPLSEGQLLVSFR